jgi:hypothetical protein
MRKLPVPNSLGQWCVEITSHDELSSSVTNNATK